LPNTSPTELETFAVTELKHREGDQRSGADDRVDAAGGEARGEDRERLQNVHPAHSSRLSTSAA
jgi:hypothetical protein